MTNLLKNLLWGSATRGLMMTNEPSGYANEPSGYANEPSGYANEPSGYAADPPTHDVPVETSDKEIVGYRVWKVLYDGEQAHLWSPSYPTCWEGPTLVAHEPPRLIAKSKDKLGSYYATYYALYTGPREHPGIHAYTKPVSGPSDIAGGILGGITAWGSVALSGIVHVGKWGYRAERATVRDLRFCLANGESTQDICPFAVQCALEDRYQCDVTYHSEHLA